MELKRFFLVALLDFSNVIRPNGSNPDGETSHFAAVWTLKKNDPRSYECLFAHVSEHVLPRFGHYVFLTSTVDALPWGLTRYV